MARRFSDPLPIPPDLARRLWLRAQRLDEAEPFGAGHDAVQRAAAHLGYVQIDTINVVERCHHHILWNRIPAYRREDLGRAQSAEKSVFEYWTHALAYVPSAHYRFFMPAMKQREENPRNWFGDVEPADLARLLSRIRREGAITIRDIEDDELVEKSHPWASRKPSKRALQQLFYAGALTISARSGMLKTYELTNRHFGWIRRPAPASPAQVAAYVLARALTAQGIVSLDSICHLDAPMKPAVRAAIEALVKRRRLKPVAIEGAARAEHWAAPETLEEAAATPPDTGTPPVHILSPFDPLVIQRKRLSLFFGYEHRFEAYLPREKRVLGYFALPVLQGDRIVAALDLKTDRAAGRLLIRKWTDFGSPSLETKPAIEAALERFERFQLAREATPIPPVPS